MLPWMKSTAGWVGLLGGLMASLSWFTPQAAEIIPRPPTREQSSKGQAQLYRGNLPGDDRLFQDAGRRGAPEVPDHLADRVGATASDSKGIEFWLTFPGNLGLADLSLFLTGEQDTTGTVTIPGLNFSESFTVMAGSVTTVRLPPSAALENSDTIEDKGIRVTASSEVTVYGLNRLPFTTDAYLGLPTDILGSEYLVLGYQNTGVVNGTQFAIVATADATTVTIIPSVTTGARAAGIPYSLVLNRGQTYQLRNTALASADLSGSLVSSDKPVAVFGGHQCANIPPGFVACDHIVEQLPPTVTWGKNFVTMPLATRLNGDTFRIMASMDGTNVVLNEAPLVTLNRGQFAELIIPGPAQISADQPILVAQYSNGSSFDGVTSDPFMMLIPPLEQFLASYTVTTPASGFPNNFINIVAPTAAVGVITLDGTAIPAATFVPIGTSGFSGAQLSVSSGSHTLLGSLPFGVFVYGFANFDSYGYPGGMSLAPVVIVTDLALTPAAATNPVGTEHCVVATVTDQDTDPVPGIRVDFTVTGVNPTAGFAATNDVGQATFCYSGVDLGTDTIGAAVGTISATATKTWIEPILQFSDGTNSLTVNTMAGQFALTYAVSGTVLTCSGMRARLENELLTISSRCLEDLRDVFRAVGPITGSITVQWLDRTGPTVADREIRRFLLERQ
jgi:hypothetical protein